MEATLKFLIVRRALLGMTCLLQNCGWFVCLFVLEQGIIHMIVQNYTKENWLSYMLLFTAVVLSRLTLDLDQAQRHQLRDSLAGRKKRKKGEA